MRLIFVLPCILLTILCWGVYGPAIHAGQFAVEAGAQPSSLKPLIGLGIAYFLIAVPIPVFVLKSKGEEGKWSTGGIIWSLIAGTVGVLSAVGIILAFKFHGAPIYVMPLVFGCAPVVHTFVTMLLARSFKEASWVFYLGVLIVLLGATGLMMFKPHDGIKVVEDQGKLIVTVNDVQVTAENPEDLKDKSVDAYNAYRQHTENKLTTPEFLLVILFIGTGALCWGAYGPITHRAQLKMEGSRLRPFICEGIAYLLFAVVVPFVLLSSPLQDPTGWHVFWGSTWSLIGGAVGAFGALGIIYAFNYGGKPILVMPLVFGCAPLVNTFVTSWLDDLTGKVSNSFYLCLMLVIAGAVIVLVFAPKTKLKTKSTEDEPERNRIAADQQEEGIEETEADETVDASGEADETVSNSESQVQESESTADSENESTPDSPTATHKD